MQTRSKRIRPQGSHVSCNDTIYKIAAKLVGVPVTKRITRNKKKAITLPGGFVYHGGMIRNGSM